jgi:isoquinoline 1-oxidoreductase beta subunit
MGQGIHSTLAALVAEELDMELGDVRVIPGPPSNVYANEVLYPPVTSRREVLRGRLNERRGLPDRTMQLTGGQSSIRDAFIKMRKAGAAARTMLVEAAARERGLDADVLRTRGGAVIYPDGSSVPYTLLAAAAGTVAAARGHGRQMHGNGSVLDRCPTPGHAFRGRAAQPATGW